MTLSIPKGFLKFSGWALLIGGLLGVIGQLIHSGSDTPESLEVIPAFLDKAVNIHVLLAWSSIFILMGMPAMYLRQAGKLKWWGWIGFPLLFVGMILEIFHGPVQIMAYPIIYSDLATNAETLAIVNKHVNELMTDQYPLSLLVLIPLMPGLFLGLLLTGIGTLRAGAMPKAAGWFTIGIFALLVAGMFLPASIPFFAAIHLVFVLFGALLAFGGNFASLDADSSASTSSAA
ncbi:hypothetical protein ACFPVX_17490 [Cohnella faecalis]|uniref:DUF4386 family protein n=1 Tax=Cohnella faecalis TaxID=2315694 RepID=A0A398CRF6_9BACL|nr:hypothetical protein [Cohnella faecalis]RIE01494.1 hypothetical protein D3H35_24380 [Cohnella faecalis]